MNWPNPKVLICFALVALFWPAPESSCQAQRLSLYQRGQRSGSSMVNLYSDVKARRPGDLLVITIDEQSDVQNIDQRLMNKQNSSAAEGSGTYGVGGGLGTAAGNLSIDQDTSASRQFNANTQFRSQRAFTDRFTVQVVDALPNGNLLVKGKRDMLLEGDSRTLVLTGVIRGVDLTTGNTVSSRLVSGLSIQYESRGNQAERRYLNQGWLGRAMNKAWPH